ncbi:MAG: hypothetical protein ACKO6C_00265, partial [Alphaproteobacteria bacterium]
VFLRFRDKRTRSHKIGGNIFSNDNDLQLIFDKLNKLGINLNKDNKKHLIDPGSINGSGGHLVVKSLDDDEKQYHLKLVLNNDSITLEHKISEIAYYKMYSKFKYGPEIYAVPHEGEIILCLEDANNPQAGEKSKFIDWKKIKETGHQSEIEKKLTNSKADLYALEILTLILATGDIFQKPDNYGVRIFGSDDKTTAIPFVVDLLPPPHKAHLTFFGKIGASKYCKDSKNSQNYSELIANLLLKSFDPEDNQRQENEIQDFHVFEFFKDGIRGYEIEDLKGGLNIILNDEFDKKINQAFHESLNHLDDYCSEDEKKEAKTIIDERKNFILSVARELRKHLEIKDVMSGEWNPVKYPQTGKKVEVVKRVLPPGAGVEFFPSPQRVTSVRSPGSSPFPSNVDVTWPGAKDFKEEGRSPSPR